MGVGDAAQRDDPLSGHRGSPRRTPRAGSRADLRGDRGAHRRAAVGDGARNGGQGRVGSRRQTGGIPCLHLDGRPYRCVVGLLRRRGLSDDAIGDEHRAERAHRSAAAHPMGVFATLWVPSAYPRASRATKTCCFLWVLTPMCTPPPAVRDPMIGTAGAIGLYGEVHTLPLSLPPGAWGEGATAHMQASSRSYVLSQSPSPTP